MRILAIETSCDETSAAVVENGTKVISNIIASSLPLHAKTGGIIPEVAARQQIKYIIPVVEKAIKNEKIDAIAVTIGPGLIGSLLVGVETAKTLAFAWNKPIVPVNHLLGHIYANFISDDSSLREGTTKQSPSRLPRSRVKRGSLAMTTNNINFPFIALIVSGGHTDLLLFKSHKNYKWLGGTRDDAAGEALDKIARILGLSYPGGPEIEKRALKGNVKAFNFPRPMIDSDDFDFSFSGLKTAVLREVSLLRHSREGGNPVNKKLSEKLINDICASAQQAIIDVLVKKTVRAAKIFNVSTIVLGGGVTANEYLRSQFKVSCEAGSRSARQLFVPSAQYTTDNAAMIGAIAFFQYKEAHWQRITANPELYFD